MIAGFQAAPVWAQVAMAFFAVTAVVMVVAPRVTTWKFRRHFDAIARGLGLAPSTSTAWPYTFALSIGDRPSGTTSGAFRAGASRPQGRTGIC